MDKLRLQIRATDEVSLQASVTASCAENIIFLSALWRIEILALFQAANLILIILIHPGLARLAESPGLFLPRSQKDLILARSYL